MAEENANLQEEVEGQDQDLENGQEKVGDDAAKAAEDSFEVPVRKGRFNPYAALRVEKRKNKELKEGEAEAEPEPEEGNGEISETINKAVAPIYDVVKRQEDERELSDYLVSNPVMKQYEKLARKVMEHPAYRDVAISFIFSALSAKDAEMRGAEKAKQAEEKAKKNKIGGSGRRTESDGELDIWNMTDTEFKALQNKARKEGVKLA